jgi:hypothetical protein
MFTDRTQASVSWPAPEQRLESLLFGAVQFVILAGTVLVAVQILVTA